MKIFKGLVFVLATVLVPNLASAVIIDFETNPSLATGPSTFASAGPEQDISYGGVTVSGGVVLGFPTFLPATPYATVPNLYGTAYHPSGSAVGDASLLSTISIAIDSSLNASTVQGLLFNGLIGDDTFNISAYSSGTLMDSLSMSLASNISSGFDVFSLDSGGAAIDLVTITADTSTGPYTGEWDFFVDSLAIGEPIDNVIDRVPEPSGMLLLILGLFGLGVLRIKRAK